MAYQEKIYLEGLTGNGDGIIGALAAVGLRAEEKMDDLYQFHVTFHCIIMSINKHL
ncbi:hypothetical protein [Nitrosococcus wardiae]|uniref:hypothetical protein n=1 Tax=Nitrosococcus wardiae TaxID=1814290 RepID=UPI00141B2A84|nr:hypothetical protein [Nitrosococcus wardiae]